MPEASTTSTPDWPVIVIPLVFLIAFPAIWCSVCLILSLGGWKRLAVNYGTDETPLGEKLSMQSGKINMVGYNNCLTVHVSDIGIHLAVMILFRVGHQPLLIPWSDIYHLRQEKILWVKRCSMEVGDPSIASLKLSDAVYQQALSLIDIEGKE